MRGEVTVAELKPIVETPPLRFSKRVEGVSFDAPTTVLRRKPRQRIHDRVEVGTDVKPPMLEIITCVDDHLKGASGKSTVEPVD
jgi:hypothetical protein